MRKPTVIDLFSGAGGTGLGFKQGGFRLLAALEIDNNAATTYEKNLGIAALQESIRDVDPRELRRSLGLRVRELDVLAGCPPCQGFTRMRNRHGVGDHRNNLVLRYLDFVAEFKPKYAIFENVPGLQRTRHGKWYYASLLKGLTALGYKYESHLVDAADFGVAQHRQRVIVIAARRGFSLPKLVPTHGAPESDGVKKRTLRRWVTVRQAIGRFAEPANLNGNGRAKRHPNHLAAKTGSRNSDRVLRFIERVPLDGGSRVDVPRRYWLPCHKIHDGHRDVYGRISWDTPSNTITTGCTNPSKGRFVHPEQTRGLTYREAAALQGFPATFVFHGQWIDAQIGNAVPPPLARAIADSLRRALRAGTRRSAVTRRTAKTRR